MVVCVCGGCGGRRDCAGAGAGGYIAGGYIYYTERGNISILSVAEQGLGVPGDSDRPGRGVAVVVCGPKSMADEVAAQVKREAGRGGGREREIGR